MIFVGLTESERLNQARLYEIAYINSIKQTENYGRVVGEINRVFGLYNNYFKDNYGRQIYYTQGVFKIKNI